MRGWNGQNEYENGRAEQWLNWAMGLCDGRLWEFVGKNSRRKLKKYEVPVAKSDPFAATAKRRIGRSSAQKFRRFE